MNRHFEGALMNGVSQRLLLHSGTKITTRALSQSARLLHLTSPGFLQSGVSTLSMCRMFCSFFRLYYLSLKKTFKPQIRGCLVLGHLYLYRFSHRFITYSSCRTTRASVPSVESSLRNAALIFLRMELGFPEVQEKLRC